MSAALQAETHVSDLTRAFEQPPGESPAGDWLLLLPVAMVAAAWLIYRWYVTPTVIPGTAEALMAELCKTHGLSVKIREFLLHVSRAADASHPAAMFLSQRHFDETITAAERKIDWTKTQSATLLQVRRAVFEEHQT